MERRELGDGGYVLTSAAMERAGFLVAFTERTGGVSTEPRFSSLNLSYSSGDESSLVARNREHVTMTLGTGPFTVGGQVHGAAIAEIDATLAGRGFDGPEGVIANTDGLTTASAGISVAVATADCAPVVLASEPEGRIAVIHSGWRGTAAGIVEKGLSLFTDAATVIGAVGPCAGGCCYEVDDALVDQVDAGVAGDAVVRRSPTGRPFLDLAATIAGSLRSLGVGTVETADLCTIHEEERFFSHRRQGPCGRQFAIGMRMG